MSKPVEPSDYISGVKVVQIEDLRIARGKTKREPGTCRHRSQVYDQNERRIWCQDCATEVEPFDAFKMMVEYWDSATKTIARRLDEAKEAERFSLRSRAAKVIDKAWRSRKTAPCCPHCSAVILPEDVVNGIRHSAGIQLELMRRKKDKGPDQ